MSSRNISLAVVMDPIQSIHPEKDTTLALMLNAERRGWQIHYLEIQDLFLKNGMPWGKTRRVTVKDDLKDWYSLFEVKEQPLDQFDIILMRKDPPVTLEYIYATYILEHAEANGSLVINKPQSLRDANEKMYATWFPHCMAPTLVSANIHTLKSFVHEHETVVFKPLAGMGGHSIFKCDIRDPNLSVVLETLTDYGSRYTMAQKYIPEIVKGDKRIFLIDGDPIPIALARIPKKGEFRGNLAVGGKGEAVPLSDRDLWICNQIGNTLKNRGLSFVGIDVIGDYLTEINITSPTCVRELEAQASINVTDRILDAMLEKLTE